MTLLVDQLKTDLDELTNQTMREKIKPSQSQVIRNEEKFNDHLEANQDVQEKLSEEVQEMKIKKINQGWSNFKNARVFTSCHIKKSHAFLHFVHLYMQIMLSSKCIL